MKPDKPVRELKCFGCLMALEMEEGLWCLKFKGLADEDMARNCQDYVGKDLVSSEDGDNL